MKQCHSDEVITIIEEGRNDHGPVVITVNRFTSIGVAAALSLQFSFLLIIFSYMGIKVANELLIVY